MKAWSLTPELRFKLLFLSLEKVSRILSVAVKCVDIEKNTSGEDGLLVQDRRSGTKARGANRIRYPGSPSSKRCQLGVGGFDALSAGANALS